MNKYECPECESQAYPTLGQFMPNNFECSICGLRYVITKKGNYRILHKSSRWKPKRIGWYFTKWDRSASRHFGHSKSMGRKDRRAGGQAMLSKKR